MTDRLPTRTKNLDRYDNPALEWSRAHEALASGPKGPLAGFFLGTVGADGRPHVAGFGAMWHDGDLYFVSGSGTLKSKNLAANPACTIAVKLPGIDLTLEGEARIVTEATLLETLAALYRDLGWPAQVEDGAFTAPFSAPSAGPPPWQVYRFNCSSMVGVGTDEPHGATRWDFAL